MEPRARAPVAVFAWITSFVAAGLVVLAPDAARADDGPAPEVRTPLDPWLVRLHRGPESNDPALLLPWVDEMAAAGRARAGSETGALLLSGAASELGRRGAAPAKAKALLEEALGAFAPDDPRSGLLWLDLADVRNDLGDPAGVLVAVARADEVASRLGPHDEPYPGPPLRARLRDDLAERGDGLRRHALAAVGRHAEAATLWERRASRMAAATATAVGSSSGADAAWEWAAEEAWAAGDRERALRNIDLAIASARDGSPVVSRVAWRMRAAFGQLTEGGDAAYRPAQITDDMFTAWRAAIRDHGDRPGGFQLALDAATFAMAARRTDELLEFCSLAFTSPGFAAEAARSVSRRLEIVAAARIALTAGRPEQALAWLRLAEHHHGGPLPRTEGFRLAIDEALRPTGDPRLPAAPAAGLEPPAAANGQVPGPEGRGPAAAGPTLGDPPPAPRPSTSGDRLEADRDGPLGPPPPPRSPNLPTDDARRRLAVVGIAATAAVALLLLGIRGSRGPARGEGSSRIPP